jgi:hypothetical protein
MQATGRLFLSRTRPCARPAADGTFGLQLYAVDRLGAHQVESWVVCWYGPEALAFWQRHQAQLVPGAVIHLTAQRMRAHQVRGAVPEIHATAAHIELEERPTTAATTTHQPAQATA